VCKTQRLSVTDGEYVRKHRNTRRNAEPGTRKDQGAQVNRPAQPATPRPRRAYSRARWYGLCLLEPDLTLRSLAERRQGRVRNAHRLRTGLKPREPRLRTGSVQGRRSAMSPGALSKRPRCPRFEHPAPVSPVGMGRERTTWQRAMRGCSYRSALPLRESGFAVATRTLSGGPMIRAARDSELRPDESGTEEHRSGARLVLARPSTRRFERLVVVSGKGQAGSTPGTTGGVQADSSFTAGREHPGHHPGRLGGLLATRRSIPLTHRGVTFGVRRRVRDVRPDGVTITRFRRRHGRKGGDRRDPGPTRYRRPLRFEQALAVRALVAASPTSPRRCPDG
jgi:hypothetical protein